MRKRFASLLFYILKPTSYEMMLKRRLIIDIPLGLLRLVRIFVEFSHRNHIFSVFMPWPRSQKLDFWCSSNKNGVLFTACYVIFLCDLTFREKRKNFKAQFI